MKKTFHDVLHDIELNLLGKTLAGISGSASLFSITEIDYNNSNVLLSVYGKRRTWTFERLEKVWLELYYRPAANVEVIFGGSGSSRNQVETIFASLAYVEWLYINNKKCIAYVGKETHEYGTLRRMDKTKEIQFQSLMRDTDPRNPLLDPDESQDSLPPAVDNKYKQAAELLKDYVLEHGLNILISNEEIQFALADFQKAYAPEVLAALDDNHLLTSLFFSAGDNSNALCYYLEKNKVCRKLFGGIGVGSAYQYGIFQRKDTGIWTTGSPQRPQELSDDEAIVVGKNIRNALVNGAHIIQEATLDSLEAYEKLDETLKATIGSQYYDMGWVHKYFSLICYDKLSGFHSPEWQTHVLLALNIKPSNKYYARSGQISMIQNYAGWFYRQFYDVFSERFGDPRQFVRIGTSNSQRNYAAEWAKRGVVGVGWPTIGDLTEYVKGDGIDRKEIQENLKANYYQSDDRTASRKAGELARFYKCNNNTVFVIMDGERLLALADNTGDYFFDGSSDMPHQRPAKWKFVFGVDEKMPEKTEGKLTSCYQLANESNLLFLYNRYYYGDDMGSNLADSLAQESAEVVAEGPIIFNTGYQSVFERNRILFGAPGTGKSFTINKEAMDLLGEGHEDDYERVTFHPDYSYAHFVGTYKPIPSKDSHGNDTITYAYVPGPFMRVYVKALRNSREQNIRPFLLIIEEINRANVAAVFGDVFQLLDRGDDQISEYPIQASEDIKVYLAKELGGKPTDYTQIRIPDNMFIWATMNSADQGVFPMDTAFKRRWDFTYLGIDDSDERIRGKYVFLGVERQQKIEWNKLRKAINHFLAKEKINEDKQLGPYFIARSVVAPVLGDEIDRERFIRIFKNKVIMYLFEDAAKQKRAKLFEGCFQNGKTRYSEICRMFDISGIQIFNHDIQQEAEPEEISLTPAEDTN